MRGFGKRGKAPGNRQRQRLLHFAAGGCAFENLAKIVSTRAFNCAREISKRVLKPVPHLWEVAKLMERQTIGFSASGRAFSTFDLNYYGPVDGHDIFALVEVLKNLRQMDWPDGAPYGHHQGQGLCLCRS